MTKPTKIELNYTSIADGKCYTEKENRLPNDEVVIEPNRDVTLEISYPLETPYREQINTGPKGMTRKTLTDLAIKAYKQVYKEEEESMTTTQEQLADRPVLLNRPDSNGKYGIWGHDIGDLVLGSAEVDENGVITLGVDS